MLIFGGVYRNWSANAGCESIWIRTRDDAVGMNITLVDGSKPLEHFTFVTCGFMGPSAFQFILFLAMPPSNYFIGDPFVRIFAKPALKQRAKPCGNVRRKYSHFRGKSIVMSGIGMVQNFSFF